MTGLGIIMTRTEMIKTLKSIKEPLVLLTYFCDGVTCEYMNSKGCDWFELLDWSDLDVHDYNSSCETWEEMDDNVLMKWVDKLNSGEYKPIAALTSDELDVESN